LVDIICALNLWIKFCILISSVFDLCKITWNTVKVTGGICIVSRKGFIIKNTIRKKIKRVVIAILSILTITCTLAKPSFADTTGFKFNMSYIYFGEPTQYAARVKDTKGSISEISPSYFDLNADGSLKTTSKIDKSFIIEMHSKGIKVVPFLSNHWDRSLGRLALSKRDKLSDQIINAILEYNLDGVNVDLENLDEEDRDSYTDFVRLLRDKIPEDKVLAVAVASNPKGLKTGWHGSYDYGALGKYSDYIMIMTYDEHYSGGVAGPVAGIEFVENSIKYALERVPKEKIVLGIPFFGRIWKNGGGMSGQGASLNDIEMLLARYRGQVTFDYVSLSPKAVITIKAGDVKPYIFGNRLDTGTYIIWYENEASIKRKLELVKKYDLKGTGSWSLGQETLNTWDYYDLWLNGHYFTDSQGHWALKSIIFAANKGWMIGNGSTSFAPNNYLTRAEAATALVRALGLRKEEIENVKGDTAQSRVTIRSVGVARNVDIAQNKGITQSSDADNYGEVVVFNDISQHWAKNEIEIAAQHNIVLGRGDGTFGPNDSITREEIAVLADRIFANTSTLADRTGTFFDAAANTLTDISDTFVDENNTITDRGAAPTTRGDTVAYRKTVLTGSSDTFADRGDAFTDEPSDNYNNITDIITDNINSTNINSTNINIAYKDVSPETCAWSYDSIIGMSQKGILTGSPDGRFHPKDRTSRAEMATLLYRMFNSAFYISTVN
jgi:spore germination protein YaaH